MKKILLVLMLIFLGHSAFAVYCWEERDGKLNHESNMTAKLGANNIVKASTYLTAATAIDLNCYPKNYDTAYDYRYQTYCQKVNEIQDIKLYAFNLGDFPNETTIKNTYYENGNTYYNQTATFNLDIQGISGGNIFENWSSYKYSDINYPFQEGYIGSSYWNGKSYQTDWAANVLYTRVLRLKNPHYVHTFCTTVGGGGGGAAGAAVNYIIKAD